jgi:hypothetical protein
MNCKHASYSTMQIPQIGDDPIRTVEVRCKLKLMSEDLRLRIYASHRR